MTAKKETNIRTKCYIALICIIILGIWCLLTYRLGVRAVILPSPTDMANAFVQLAPSLSESILASLKITLIGFAIGTGVGLLMGLVMGYSKTFLQVIGPFMEVTRPIPVFALIPLFMLWFGIGILPQVLLIALGVSSVLGVQTYEAIRNMPIVYVQAAFNLGATKMQVFKTVVVPCIIPHLIGAIRVAAATSWGLDVCAEFMGVQTGLGHIMIIQQNYLNTPQVLAIVLIYSVLAITLDQLIRVIERRVTAWTDRSSLSFEGLTTEGKMSRKEKQAEKKALMGLQEREEKNL